MNNDNRNQSFFVVPAGGREVRMPLPERRNLNPAGEFVPASQYWQRRLLKRDVVLGQPPVAVAGAEN